MYVTVNPRSDRTLNGFAMLFKLGLIFCVAASAGCLQLAAGQNTLVSGLLRNVASGVNTVGNVIDSVKTSLKETEDNAARSLVEFTLFTRANISDGVRIYANNLTSIRSSNFDSSKKTKFCTHGYLCNTKPRSGCDNIKNALLKSGDYNVILVDWSALDSKLLYAINVAVRLPAISSVYADLVQDLLDEGADADDMHLIGHSLGAHLSGLVGEQTLAPHNKGVITGLDPAGPLYEGSDSSHRLSPDDARFVEAIHTNGGILGIVEAVGDLDVYYNGGVGTQPGCPFDVAGICSHCFVFDAYINAIENPNAFIATQCPSMAQLRQSACAGNATTFLGLEVNQESKGVYYIDSSLKADLSAVRQCVPKTEGR